ncbi:MAG: site-specific integrase [Nitrospinae bacterium]|nr:site-specific integrase [Nitrospinota bacterium]
MAKAKGVYKRGNIWWVRYAGTDGKIRRETSNSPQHKVAQALLIARKKDVQEGREPIPIKRIENHSFNELAEIYKEWAKRQKAFKSKSCIIKMLVEEFGNCPLRRFTTLLIEEFQSKLMVEGKANATVNRRLACLKHMFTKATEWEMVEEEVNKRIKRVKLLPENNKRLRYLSREEVQDLIDACKPHLKPIVVTALNTGMRKEEILSLEWDKHIDLNHGFILLDKTKNGDRREIPINQTLRKTLQGIVRRLDSPYVFTDKEGNRFQNCKRSFYSAIKKAGIKDFRFHDCRHTFASQLIMAGVDITTVKELLGHKTLTMTLRYAHLAPSHKVSAVELLDENVKSKPTAQLLHSSTKKGLTRVG